MVLPAQASNGSDPYSPAMMTAPAGQISFDGEGAPPDGGWDILNRASGYIDRRSAREQGFELRTGRVDGAEAVHHAQGRIGGHERVRSCFQGNGCQHRVEGADLDVALEEPKAQPEVLELLDHLGGGGRLDISSAHRFDQSATLLTERMVGALRVDENRRVENDQRPPPRSSSNSRLSSPTSGTELSGASRMRSAACWRRRLVEGKARSIASRMTWATDVPRASASRATRSYRSLSNRI